MGFLYIHNTLRFSNNSNYQIPYISDKNESQEFICSLIISFLSICFFRNFYLSITTKCYITKEDSEKNKQIYLKENSENSKTNSNEKSNLLENKIKNEEKTIFYCKKCRFYRGDRAHHCSVCNVCVEKMDHHCHVIKNCVGFKNYKFFLSYLFGVTSTAFSILIFSLMSCYKSIKGFKVKYS